MIIKTLSEIIIKIFRSSQHRQLYVLKVCIYILKRFINYFDYKGDIMVNKNGSYIGTDGVFLSTKATKRYLKSNNTSKINQGFALSKVIKKLDAVNVVFDIGANVGEVSIYFSKMYPNSKIFSIEPSTRNLIIFKENMHDQFFECKNITIIEKAVSNYNGKIKITKHLNAQNTIILNPEINREINNKNLKFLDETEEVEVVTLENLCEQYQINEIDFMKIDIEGAEPLLTISIKKLQPKMIFMEISSKNTEASFHEMYDKLKDIYQFYDNEFILIEDLKLFISNLFKNPSNYYKISCTDVWLVRKDINKLIK